MVSILSGHASNDGSVKYIFTNAEGNKFEAIYFNFYDEKDKKRPYFNYYHEDGKLPKYTICISSQAGCAMGCTFCATGYGGFFKNLSADEMLDQVKVVKGDLFQRNMITSNDLGNVILMGMGEPLMNLSNVVSFCRKLNALGLNMIKMVSISTIGIAPKVRELANIKDLKIKLFFSLHSPFDEERSRLMPINNQYKIKEAFESCLYFAKTQQQKVIVCYLLLKDINDSERHARAFSELLDPQFFETQILTYNPISSITYERTPSDRAAAFAQVVKENGLTTDIRVSKGQDVQGGCGQLVHDLHGKTIHR
jgi:23S rRNA (adenine2503-C2)-methyltransferase